MSTTIRLIAMSRQEILQALFRDSRPDSLVAYGNIRTNKTTPDVGLRPLIASRPSEAAATADALEAKGINPSHIRWNLYGLGILAKDEQADVDKALKDRLQGLLDGNDPRHLFTHSYRLAELAALNVDLDVGTRKDDSRFVDADTALEIVKRLVLYGKLPAPSMVGFSGQGLYILYALQADKTDARDATDKAEKASGATSRRRKKPALPKASRDNQEAYKRAAEALIKRCITISRRFIPSGYPPTLNPDPSSKSPIQAFKAPDSLHPGTGEPIRYYRLMMDSNDDNNNNNDDDDNSNDHNRDIRRYTLGELLSWYPERSGKLNLMRPSEPEKTSYKERFIADLFDDDAREKRRYTARKGQAIVPFVRRLEDLEGLAKHRGKIPEGKRSLWTLILYNTFRDIHIRHVCRDDNEESRARAIALTMEFNERYFEPPLTLYEVRHTASENRRDFRNTTLVRLLDVTYAEAVEAGMLFIVPERRRLELDREKREDKARASKAVRDEARNEAMAKDFREGLTVVVIARKYSLSEPRVWQIKRTLRLEGKL